MCPGIAGRLQLGLIMPLPLPEDRPRLEVTLDDGSHAQLSPLRPEDRDLLEEGMSQLSPQSRFARFGQGRGGLTRAELDYLSRVDQRRHVAWGAIVDNAVAGVGRYILIEDEACAEVAITVVDRLQGRGVGRALFQALVAVARSDGVEAFCFDALPQNLAVQRILKGLGVDLGTNQGLVMGRARIADLPESSLDAGFVSVMERSRGPG
jgi:GNAT superfamily N-acetyltransferase